MTDADDHGVTTADFLEIIASGGNGAGYINVPFYLEKAAKELREQDAEIVKLNKKVVDAEAEIEKLRRLWGAELDHVARKQEEVDRLREALAKKEAGDEQ